ncbi:hypothetical protein F5B17DRAFT_151665 [Nemania serpens]|nr:hypothetical protein F5B17DRAFT_151665 [Nemania serpens]
MSPTYTMSAHLCKEIYKSFQNRQTFPESSPSSTSQASAWPAVIPRRSPSPEKRTSVDSNRSDSSSPPMSRSSSGSSWSWGGR